MNFTSSNFQTYPEYEGGKKLEMIIQINNKNQCFRTFWQWALKYFNLTFDGMSAGCQPCSLGRQPGTAGLAWTTNKRIHSTASTKRGSLAYLSKSKSGSNRQWLCYNSCVGTLLPAQRNRLNTLQCLTPRSSMSPFWQLLPEASLPEASGRSCHILEPPW